MRFYVFEDSKNWKRWDRPSNTHLLCENWWNNITCPCVVMESWGSWVHKLTYRNIRCQSLLPQSNSNTFTELFQGGMNSVVTMTAYVLVTLRETNYAFKNRVSWNFTSYDWLCSLCILSVWIKSKPLRNLSWSKPRDCFVVIICLWCFLNLMCSQNIQAASNKARQYLENNLHTVINDKYDLSIVTYALHVSESSRASEALTALNRLVTTEGMGKSLAIVIGCTFAKITLEGKQPVTANSVFWSQSFTYYF